MAKLFVAQILGIVFAALVFQFGLEPRVAGVLAGTMFIAVGFYAMRISWLERRNRHFTLAVLGLALVHLFGVAFPMLVFRILHWDQPFSKVAVWGLSGPEFHSLSTRLYGVWITVTAVAWYMERKKKDPRGSSFRT